MLYMEGNGVPESAAQALQWFTKSAGAGDALGELQLANMHYHGVHQAINMEKAVLNFKSSAVHGSIVALYNLGLMYSVGDGVERNWPVITLECCICSLDCCICRSGAGISIDLGAVPVFLTVKGKTDTAPEGQVLLKTASYWGYVMLTCAQR